MFFGLPWYAIIAIVSVAGGLIYSYKEKELEMEAKRMSGSREVHELRQIVHNLKSRVEKLEAEVSNSKKSSAKSTTNPLSDIEIDDEVEEQNSDNTSRRNRTRN
ncbi:hypothetical protein [Gracilimonas sp.]|uniref:hypothetical protein n=1 Tax=Gracilimonas sp. TaxID=1974203 RepID=UPI002871ADF2|nr:hypothetical protein [Gracilimonas sp.]